MTQDPWSAPKGDGGLGLRQIGDRQQVVSLQIGDDDGGTVRHDLLGLGDHVAILGQDVLDQLIVLAEKGAALIVVLDGEPRALQPIAGEHLVDERQGDRLVIDLAEIIDPDVDGWRRAVDDRCLVVPRLLLLCGDAVTEQRRQQQQRGSGTPEPSGGCPRRDRAGA